MKAALRQRLLIVLMALFAVLPWILVAAGGFFWLWQEQWLVPWLMVALGCGVLSWLAAARFKAHVARPPVPDALKAEPAGHWSHTQKLAWQRVHAICERIEEESPDLEDWATYSALFRETVETVAVCFHPRQEQAFLEMRIPDFLRIVELLSADLRSLSSEKIPGSHILTVNDVLKGQRMATQLKQLYNWYRVISFALSPASAVFNEVRHRVTGDTTSLIWREMKLYLASACVKKVGFYAIQLYSGELDFGVDQAADHLSRDSANRLDASEKWQGELIRDPLRIVVSGQTNSGKSSLINALFGEVRAATDVIPVSRGVQPLVLQREELPQTILFDTAGYEDPAMRPSDLVEIRRVMEQCDLLILVCPAHQAARDADIRLLRDLQARCRELKMDCAPVIVAMTHIDRLRPPREWNPPYCLDPADGTKASNIAAAANSVAADLEIEIDRVVPLNLIDGYNVDEGLVPAILRLLPEAQRSQYLRCLKSYHDENHWARIWKQSRAAGLFIASASSEWVLEKWKKSAR